MWSDGYHKGWRWTVMHCRWEFGRVMSDALPVASSRSDVDRQCGWSVQDSSWLLRPMHKL